MDFPAAFISWIYKCLSTPTYSIIINGQLEGFFEGKKGIRQGDPLSPYLFVICMEVLSKMLDKAFHDKKIQFHPLCSKIDLTHLCFGTIRLFFLQLVLNP